MIVQRLAPEIRLQSSSLESEIDKLHSSSLEETDPVELRLIYLKATQFLSSLFSSRTSGGELKMSPSLLQQARKVEEIGQKCGVDRASGEATSSCNFLMHSLVERVRSHLEKYKAADLVLCSRSGGVITTFTVTSNVPEFVSTFTQIAKFNDGAKKVGSKDSVAVKIDIASDDSSCTVDLADRISFYYDSALCGWFRSPATTVSNGKVSVPANSRLPVEVRKLLGF